VTEGKLHMEDTQFQSDMRSWLLSGAFCSACLKW